jgi:hypothetical protein
MNQNPDIAVTANSITLEIMKELFLLKKKDVFQNFPDEQSLNNVMDEVYNLYYKNWNYKAIDEKLSHIMHINGAVSKELQSIQYLSQHHDMAVFVKYDDLVTQPEKELRKVYNFLNLPYYPHTFTNLNQLVVNGVQYNDSIVGKNMHTIRTEKVMKVENKYKNKIPERFVKEYGHITF